MNISKTEKVLIAILIAVALCAASVFLVIMPQLDNVETAYSELAAVKAQRDEMYEALAREDVIDEEIAEAIARAESLSGRFYNELTTYEADETVRGIIESCGLSTDALNISELSTQTLTLSQFVASDITYPIKDSADIASGISAAGTEEAFVLTPQYDENGEQIPYTKEEIFLSLLSQNQVVGAVNVNFQIEGSRADVISFIDYVHNLPQATYINSISIPYSGTATVSATWQEDIASDEAEVDIFSGGAAVSSVETIYSGSDTVSTSVALTLFCVQPIDFSVIDNIEAETEIAANEDAAE